MGHREGDHHRPHVPAARSGPDLVVALAVLALAACSVLGGIDGRFFAVAEPRDHQEAILDNALEHLSLRSFDEVASLQGDVRKLANADTGSRYRIDLAVSQADLGLLEINAVLVDRSRGMEVDRLQTFRSKRN